jgi:adenine-specific DNA-methyltransferase
MGQARPREPRAQHERFPPTRYQGSKLKLLGWLGESLRSLSFASALDLFGGTGAVADLLKAAVKRVVYNDILRCNQLVGRALVENGDVRLAPEAVDALLERQPGVAYDDVIARSYAGVYFLAEEDAQIDVVAQNAARLRGHARAIAYFALFQACLAKRPYNLFHRANLNLRTASVPRSFGNKATWDRPLAAHLRDAVAAANAAVFDNGQRNRAICADALEAPTDADLVYVDPPYVNRAGQGVDYGDFYHFLEGLTDYGGWVERLDHGRKHRPYRSPRQAELRRFCARDAIGPALDAIFARYARSVLVVSYRANGTPSAAEIERLLRRHKRSVRAVSCPYRYVLSPAAGAEVLFIAE